MKYISTRGDAIGSYSDVLLEGLAVDGGLAVPESVPTVAADTFEQWRTLPYPALAAQVIGLFATDIPSEVLERLCEAAYAPQKFASTEIVPLTPLGDGMTLVGLSEGPTLAFKDMAMQFLGEAMGYVLDQRDAKINILGATSGDTGSAAEHAFRGRDRVAIFMLSPQGRMSPFQRAQMYSLQDDNIHNLAVEGVFDDCQLLVKTLSEDIDFKRANNLSAVNSINFGRISAQIVYYVWAWLRATDAVATAERETFEVSFAVPSGNFGNILSGYYAKLLGVPIRTLVLATNENNVLDDFFRTGTYRPRGSAETLATSSPSMDVSKASNLERFIFDFFERDAGRTAAAWRELSEQGFFTVADHGRFASEYGFVSGTSTHADRLATIRHWHAASGVVIDPHTADGAFVARQHVEDGIPMLVLETAKPQKFAETIAEALGEEPEVSPATLELLDAPQKVKNIPADADLLRRFVNEHAVE